MGLFLLCTVEALESSSFLPLFEDMLTTTETSGCEHTFLCEVFGPSGTISAACLFLFLFCLLLGFPPLLRLFCAGGWSSCFCFLFFARFFASFLCGEFGPLVFFLCFFLHVSAQDVVHTSVSTWRHA